MPDVIKLLPDAVANQIAAGEVIQRPASAVKDLMENAIDAGGNIIKVFIKDAGKGLIQIIDNGCGMSETDARMSFERHATSKIREAEDIFSIRTMGFRGEALASVAAIAQVELKTKKTGDETGTLLVIEGSDVKSQEVCSCPEGTSISIKNLFYNTPARRNFLKSNPVEMRHIIDEFQRIALAHPDVYFTLNHDGSELFHLKPANLQVRIVQLFGKAYQEGLIRVEEETDLIKISGFIGTPKNARKTRGEQFFFVNKRFIKDAYLNHAVVKAFEGLIPADSFPLYVIHIEMDPANIDVNVHPTKTEIKFNDERLIYSILRSAVKRGLGVHHSTPSIDYNNESSFSNIPLVSRNEMPAAPTIRVNPDFNPFHKQGNSSPRETSNRQNWEKMYEIGQQQYAQPQQQDLLIEHTESIKSPVNEPATMQLHNRYILSHVKSGILLIDQQAAHERILFEQYLEQLEKHQGSSQQSLFPQTIELNAGDFDLVRELLPELKSLGFDIRIFGKNTIVIDGVPADIRAENEHHLLEGLLEQYKQNHGALKLGRSESLAAAMAKQSAIKAGQLLSKEEMRLLIDQLFACQLPAAAINGKATFSILSLEELMKRFDKIA